MKKHTGSKSIADFFGWDSGKWKTRPIRIGRNIGLVLIVLSLGFWLASGFMRCDLWEVFC